MADLYVADPARYDTMDYRRAGRSGLKLPGLSLGLWHNFGDDKPFEVQRAVLRRAFDVGVTHWDLANNYGPPYGSAEANFGQHFTADFKAHRDELVLTTKAGYDMWPGPYGDFGSRKYLLSSLDASLARLRVDYVDVFYHHRPDPETPLDETMGALASAVQQGKALYVGLSNYDAEQTRAAAEVLRGLGIPLLLHQPRYSMFDRGLEDGLLGAIDEAGAGCVVYSPLEQGMLTDRYLDGHVPSGSRAAVGHFLTASKISEDYLTHARALAAIAEGRGQTLAQLALTWVLRDPRVTSAIIGASSVAQLDNNIAALADEPLTADELTAIEPHAITGLLD